jgi:DNA replication protein DnaC
MNNRDVLISRLKELRLPTMLAMWDELAKKGLEEGWSYLQYLSVLCDYEGVERQKRRLNRRLIEAKLPPCKSLESYDFSLIPSLNKAQVMSLTEGDLWIREGKNLLIFGPSGVGKTHLAAGIGEKLVLSGYRVLFVRTTELLQRLQAAKKEFTLPSELMKLEKYDCLILDDFGYVKKTEAETSLLFELISDRYESRSLVITCNQPFQEWNDIFDDSRMAIAAVDRLVHHGTILELKSESFRKREAKNRLDREVNKTEEQEACKN